LTGLALARFLLAASIGTRFGGRSPTLAAFLLFRLRRRFGLSRGRAELAHRDGLVADVANSPLFDRVAAAHNARGRLLAE
jgi:hypothetical protein